MFSAIASIALAANLFLVTPVTERTATDSTAVRKIEARTNILEAREAALERRKAALAEFEAKRREALEEIKTRREEFKVKLAEIRDERKQKILENLDARIANVNTKWVTHWSNTLTRLTEILAKIEEKSGGEVEIAAAEAAIAAAQTAVNTQAGNTYEFEIGDEETLGESISTTLKEFHEDLRVVQAAVKTAREEVGKVLRELKNEEN
jgi:hypothetical protein